PERPRKAFVRPRPIQTQKGFIDGVGLHERRGVGQRTHHPAGHVAIERVVGREDHHAMLLQALAYLEVGVAHLAAQRLYFIATGDDAAVVVREHGYGSTAQVRRKDTLARGVEVVAVYQTEGRRTHCAHLASLVVRKRVGDDAPDACILILDQDGWEIG